MICFVWSGHVHPEAWTFSAFRLRNAYSVGLSPNCRSEFWVVFRNFRCCARFHFLPLLSQGLCGLPHLSRTRGRQASVSVSLTEIFKLCPRLSCRLLPTTLLHRSRLSLWLLCRWSAYCREIVGISCQQANTFYVVLNPSLFFLF